MQWLTCDDLRRRSSTDALPVLYVNQLVSAELTWWDVGLRMNLTSDLDAAPSVANVLLRFDLLSGAAAANSGNGSVHILLKLRVPGCCPC